MVEITSLQNPKFKRALQLHTSRGRKQQNRIIVFGEREIQRAQASGIELEEVFVRSGEESVLAELEICSSATDHVVDSGLFEKLTFGDRADRIVAIAERPPTPLPSLTDVKSVVVLAGIEKPGNIGAVIRSADGAGVDAVVIDDSGSDLFHPNSIRASMGAVFAMKVAKANPQTIRDWLKSSPLNVLLARVDGSSDFYASDFGSPTAFVLGNEARGLDESWNVAGFKSVHLPMSGIADSLNVSTTAAVMFYEWLRQNR